VDKSYHLTLKNAMKKYNFLLLSLLLPTIYLAGVSFGQSLSLPVDSYPTPAIQPAAQNQQTPQSKQLPLYGSNFFSKSKSMENILAFGSGTFPSDYSLGPGDRLGIYLLGKSQQNFEVIVNVEGKIFIPTVGVFYVNNLKIEDFQKFLKKELTKFYDNFTLDIMLIEAKRFPVIVVGDVNYPGKYFLSSINTILDAIVIAGGSTPHGSLRNIEVFRENKLCTTIDLYQFLMKGQTTNDLFLSPKDKIVVPLINDIVSIEGEVRRPARFELKASGEEKLSDIIELAGGFTDLALTNKIEISRMLPSGERTVLYANFQTIARNDTCPSNLILKNNDKVRVFSIKEQTHPRFVYIHGEVKRPGKYEFEENLRISDLILKAGNLTRSAFTLECEVAKVDPKKATTFLKLELNKILNDSSCSQNVLLEEDDRVFIRRIPEWEVGPIVEIIGEARFPGIYAITEDTTTLSEVIKKAGGFTDDALIREATLIRKSSKISIDKEYMRLKQIPRDQLSKSEYEYLVMKEHTRDIGRIVVDFYKLLVLNDTSEDVTLKDGDIINIPEAPNVVYVTGRVSRQGGVLFEPNKSIKYYLKKAGGTTWDAKKRKIKITKVTGEIIDDEDVSQLVPGDIIWVPRKPDRDWWEIFRQTIAVIAQVATAYIVVDRAILKE